MTKLKKLPSAEFEIMKIIWSNPTPILTTQITEQLHEKDWKPQTVLTLLKRLISRGFLSSEKAGKERMYVPLIAESEYLQFETDSFLETFHNNSVTGLMNALYGGKKLDNSDLDSLEEWLKGRKEQ